MKAQPLVSIVVPIYNVQEYIAECLYSLIRQTYRNIEIICVDDCTLDNSMYIVRQIQRIDPRVKVVTHTENRGLGGARNTGIGVATGKYIMFVDSDDGLVPDAVRIFVDIMECKQVEAAVCGVLCFLPNGEQIPFSTYHYNKFVPSHRTRICSSYDFLQLIDMWPSSNNKIFRLDAIKRNNFKFPEKLLYEDHYFYYSYFSIVKSYYYVNKCLYLYRKARPNSITSFATGRETEIFKVLDLIAEKLKENLSNQDFSVAMRKLSYRLLMERQYLLFNSPDKWYKFTLKSYKYLMERYSLEDLKYQIDSFYGQADQFYSFMYSSMIRAKYKLKSYMYTHKILYRLVNKLLGRKINENLANEEAVVSYVNNPIIYGYKK